MKIETKYNDGDIVFVIDTEFNPVYGPCDGCIMIVPINGICPKCKGSKKMLLRLEATYSIVEDIVTCINIEACAKWTEIFYCLKYIGEGAEADLYATKEEAELKIKELIEKDENRN